MNILPAIILLGVSGFSLGSGERDDLIRFTNGDQLHGKFAGIKAGPVVTWKRDDMKKDVEFETSVLRQVVLNGGRPDRALVGLSHIGTVNGDRLPGSVIALSNDQVTLQTEFAGTLSIPRARVGLIAPKPLGGRVLYQGPFTSDEWSMIDLEHPEGLPQQEAGEGLVEPRWRMSGSAWYWENEKMGTALVLKSGVPDQAVLQFDVSWKNRLSLAIAFHADFENPLDAEEQLEQSKRFEDPRHPNHLPLLLGSSYVLQLNPHYAVLCRSVYDEDGAPRFDRVQTSNTPVRLGDSGTARIELRFNRVSGEIILFVDGKFAVQWSELPDLQVIGEGYAGKGGGLAFFAQSENAAIRISEVVVAEWNGMPDAARSLQVDDSDIVLMANGRDRMSGNVKSIADGELQIEGRYGDFQIPMEDVAEIRFAKSGLDKLENEQTSNEVKVRFYPLGRVSGRPLGGSSEKLRIFDESFGEVEVSLESASMLEFESTGNFIDDWDHDF